MKGTPLLVLALLVTRGLGIACPMFYELLSVVSFGIRPLLDSSMDLINATEPEREAIKKAQDCFIDTGLLATCTCCPGLVQCSSSMNCLFVGGGVGIVLVTQYCRF
uniref:Uncharacterized protein n=1 Tax=Sus scrofa TaxID=9823 RepID=A0A8D1V780_PIG